MTMNTKPTLVSVLVAGLVSLLPSLAEASSTLDGAPHLPGYVLLKTQQPPSWFDPARASLKTTTTSFRPVDAILQTCGVISVSNAVPSIWHHGHRSQKIAMGFDRWQLVAVDSATDLHALCGSLSRLDVVEHAHPIAIGKGASELPSDSYFHEQWHHRNLAIGGGLIDADVDSSVAWEIHRGDLNTIVAVLDTGLLTNHPEFSGRVLPGWDFINNDGDPHDDHQTKSSEGHGTKVTGIIAADGDNSFGIAGMDWNCRILPVKVLDNTNRGPVTALIEGLIFAADEGADVINMSLEGFDQDPLLDDALDYALSQGSILVACSGNGGIGNADRSYPGAAEQTITVGFTKTNDRRDPRSGTGRRLDFMAPGVNIVTLDYSIGNERTTFTGCSASTPIVSGVIALMVGLNPGITQDEVYSILAQTSKDLIGSANFDLPGRDDQYGWGRVNAAKALTLAMNGNRYYGSPSEGTGGVAPILYLNHSLRIGELNFKIFVDEALGSTSGFLVMGTGQDDISVGQDITFLINNPLFFLGLPFDGSLGEPGDGFAQLGPIPVPNNPELEGALLYLQAFSFDPAHPDGVAHTEALEIEIQP